MSDERLRMTITVTINEQSPEAGPPSLFDDFISIDMGGVIFIVSELRKGREFVAALSSACDALEAQTGGTEG